MMNRQSNTVNRQGRGRKAPTNKRPGSPTGLFILIAILALVAVILFFKEPLRTMFATQEQPMAGPPPVPSQSYTAAPPTGPVAGSTATDQNQGVIIVEGGNTKPIPTEVPLPSLSPNNSAADRPTTQDPPETKAALKPAKLYWVKVSDDGVVHLQKVTRPLALGDSPMSTAIRSLLRGPSANELSGGLLSLIPKGTELLSAYVQNRTAFLNFSDEFQFNPVGSDGYKSQLRQVIYTATEFNTVDNVQILINGKRLQYLGADGVFVGQPLGRTSL